MKILLTTIILFVSCIHCFSQNNFEKFREEMKNIEAKEKEYTDYIWGKNEYTQTQKDSIYPYLKKLREDKLAFARKAIDANRNDAKFLWALNVYVQNYLTIDELESELKKFSTEVQQTEEWKKKMDYVKYSRLNMPGKPCTDFSVKGHDGKEIRLSDLLKKNKIVFVDFWASWCGACRAMMPHLKEIYPEYKKKGVEFLSVSLDENKETWEKAFQEENIPWIDGSNLLGWKDPLVTKYAINGIPHKVLIAQDGTIIGTGFYGLNELEKTIDAYLEKIK